MRRTSRLVAVAALLAGCAAVRPPAPAGSPGRMAEPAAPPARGVECVRDPRIELWERRLRSQPELRDAVEQSLARGAAYLPRLREILARHDVPEMLALLPALESGFDPRARGRYGELGLWQLRRQTARRYGLVVSARRDDRLSPERATEAAARYLRHLRARYGEWPLALAAYNAGERRIDRALARHPDATFWDLAENGALPRTSREFVPHFFAITRLADPASC